MSVFLAIVAVSLIEYVGDSNFKAYARQGRWSNLMMGLTVYAAMVFVLIQILRKTNVMYMNGMWDGVSAVIETLLAFFLLHETLSNGVQWAGLAMVILGIFGLSYGTVPRV